MNSELDRIWKALADETRRGILDCLRGGSKTTTQLVEEFPGLSRFAVMKHLQVLRDAGLVITREEGRRSVNSLNAVPIRQIYERWVSKFAEHWAVTLLGLKETLENDAKQKRSQREAKTGRE